MKKKQLAILIVFIILVCDQVLKFWIKTNFMLGQEKHLIGNWFILHFVENNGMAFGFEFAGEYGKIFLTLFRLVAVGVIGWYLFKLIEKGIPRGLVISIALIAAGALGNIVDSVFYGKLFSDSWGKVAEFLPESGGYATILHGKVVDMFYFPIIRGSWPSWSPINANEPFIFFRPVFNIADSAISVGIFSILLFYRRFFNDNKTEDKKIEKENAKDNA